MFGKCFRFLNVSVASQSEITRRLDKSTIYESEEWKCESSGFLSRSEITHDEHPLSLGKSSIWNQFFQVSYWPELIRYQFHRWSILLFLFSILWISFYFVNFFSHFSFGGGGEIALAWFINGLSKYTMTLYRPSIFHMLCNTMFSS